jgi:polyketide synthase PksJ
MKYSSVTYKKTVTELFETQVQKTPNCIALQDKNIEYTYEILNEKTNQIAYHLKNQLVQSGDFVALLLEPGADFIVCLIAIIKLGAIYVPLDTQAPKTRLKELLRDTQPRLIITTESFDRQCAELDMKHYLIQQLYLDSKPHPKENSEHDITPGSALHMIYTSGSTGRPKGVIIPHQAVVNVAFVENTLKVQVGNKMAQFSNIAFDGSSYEIWTALLNGATLCVIPTEARFNHSKLKQTLLEYGITFLFLPTSYLHQLIKSAPNVLDPIQSILFGGEQINTTLIKQFIQYRQEHNRELILINGYGPTETTAYICRQIIDTRRKYDKPYLESIGTLITHTKAYILDDKLQEVTEGELYISGINLAIGYHQCDLQNAEKFIVNPFSKKAPFSRLYKTGDKVRQLDSGDLLYLGRYDDQVKVGGFRVHLNEIETALLNHPKVTMAAVHVELLGGAHKTLTAYLVFSDNEIVHAEELRDFIKQSLPAYMLPAKWIKVDKLPLTLIGKVDKSKLEKMPHTDLSLHIDVSSESSIEEQIKKIWCELLNRNAIDIYKNLFDLGANSLLITDACTKINKALHTELQVGDLLAHPTIHKLSRFIEGDIDLITIKKRRKAYSSDIAIVGMSCRFPGSNNLDEFWRQLCEGKESLEQFDGNSVHLNASNYVPVRGILSEIDQFDAQFFGFNAIEARLADPQQRLLLQCSWHALEHAGIAPNKSPDKVISVFAGMSDSTYLQENLLKNKMVTTEQDLLHQRIASSTSMLSTQISYRLNLQGRSVNVNTACSTGLLAVDQACQDLILGYSDIALAGAASIVVPQHQGYLYQLGSIVSSDGHCRPFSNEANGTVFSNGVGVVVLKRLNDAIKDKDTIYAVIKGRGINNDGAGKLGFTAPSTLGQMVCIRSALDDAHLHPEEIGYVEAHGTATELGDIVEFDALNKVYKEQTSTKQYCALGSVKANIGHTDVVAGIAGLIKTALCLYHHKIPPLIHYNHPNPHLDLDDSPFFINKTLMNWDVGLKKRYAAVSSFGVGGTNAHMILSEHDTDWLPQQNSSKEELIIVSAKTPQALEEHTQNVVNMISTQNMPTSNIQSISYSLQTSREDFSWRQFAVGSNQETILKEFSQKTPFFCENNTHESIIFMFPGQGSQYPTMAMDLYNNVPKFAATMDKGLAIVKSCIQVDLLEMLNNPSSEQIHLTQYSQPALFIIEYALANLLIDYGIKPDALMGHSLGEYVAACVAGVFSFEEGVTLICNRSLLMSLAPQGEMLAVECTRDEALDFERRFYVELSLHNAPIHCVLSGDFESIARLEHHLSSIQKPYQKIPVSHAFHSRFMEPLKNRFLKLFDTINLMPPSINMISNVTGDWIPAEQVMDGQYWYEHLRHTVKLCDGFKKLLKDTHPLFIEVGMGHSLSIFLKEVVNSSPLKNQPHITHLLPNRHKKTTDVHQLLTAIGQAWQLGIPIQWNTLYSNPPTKIALPSYPFQKQRYWIEPDPIIQTSHTPLYIPAWSRKSLLNDYQLLPETIQSHSWIIFKESSSLSTEFITLLEQYKAEIFVFELSSYYEELNPHYFKINPGEKEQYVQCITGIKNNLKSPYFVHLFSLESLGSPLNITHQLDLGFYSLLYLSQAILEVMGIESTIKLLALTCGTQKITGLEPSIPINACIHGACAVISKEYPSLEFRSIDIDSNTTNFKQNISFLIHNLIQPWSPYFTAKALRGDAYWDLSYQNLNSTPEQTPFKDNGVYLITGGLGGMALALCDVITRHAHNPYLILISRTPVVEEEQWTAILHDKNHPQHQQISSLVALKKEGAIIHWHQIDINNAESLSSLVAQYNNQLGSFNGLIHAAGVAGGGIIPLKTQADAHQVLQPKLEGTYHLAEAFKNIRLDFVVLMSSLVALVGEPGQIDYAAANAALNTFATANLFSSNTVVSINWNTWNDIGMAIKTNNSPNISFLNRGNDISSQQGKELFLKILQSGYEQVIVSNYALEHHDTIVAHYKKNTLSSNANTPREQLNINNAYCPPQNKLEEQLVILWQTVLGIQTIGIDDDFFTIGGHSLNALQVIDKTNKYFKCALSIQQLYKSSTIREMSLLIQKNIPSQAEIIVPLNQCKEKPPYLFLCHPASGMIYCFNFISAQILEPMSIYGIQDPSITEGSMLFNSVLDMATRYLKAMKTIQPQGPYYLMGYSFGGTIVYEMAHLLNQEDEHVALLAMIDGWSLFSEQHYDKERFIKGFKQKNQELSDTLISLAWSRMQLLLEHTPTNTRQDMILFKATDLIEEYQAIDRSDNGWSHYTQGAIDCYPIKACHDTILNKENSFQILDILNKKGYFHR